MLTDTNTYILPHFNPDNVLRRSILISHYRCKTWASGRLNCLFSQDHRARFWMKQAHPKTIHHDTKEMVYLLQRTIMKSRSTISQMMWKQGVRTYMMKKWRKEADDQTVGPLCLQLFLHTSEMNQTRKEICRSRNGGCVRTVELGVTRQNFPMLFHHFSLIKQINLLSQMPTSAPCQTRG